MTYGQCTDRANTFFIYILAGSYDFCRVVTAGVLTFLVPKMILHRPCYTVNIARPLKAHKRSSLEVGQLSETRTAHSEGGGIPHASQQEIEASSHGQQLNRHKAWQGEGHTRFNL